MNKSQREMEEKLKFIESFASTISKTFQQFSSMIKAYMNEKMKDEATQKQHRQQKLDRHNARKEKLNGGHTELESEKKDNPANENQINAKAFTLFVGAQRMKIVKQHTEAGTVPPGFKEIACIAAKRWAELPQEEKTELLEYAREMQKREEERKERTDTLEYYEKFSITNAEIVQKKMEEKSKRLNAEIEQKQNKSKSHHKQRSKSNEVEKDGEGQENIENQANPEKVEVHQPQSVEQAHHSQNVEKAQQPENVENISQSPEQAADNAVQQSDLTEKESENAEIPISVQEKREQEPINQPQEFEQQKELINQFVGEMQEKIQTLNADLIEEKETPKVQQSMEN